MARLAKISTILFFTCGLQAQEQALRLGKLTTTQATVLKASPKNSAPTLKTLPSGSDLDWIEGVQKGNFYRVATSKGPVGWVPVSSVNKVSDPPPAPTPGEITEAASKCFPTLDACPINGCEQEGTAHALMNQSKRTFATGTPTTIHFSDFSLLQDAADPVVGQGHEIPDRSVLQNLQVGSQTLGEGSAVKIVAFLASGPAGPHPNTGESVNCNIKTPQSNDFHIPVTENKSETEFDGIVVEMIPQGQNSGEVRSAGWNLTKLTGLKTKQRQVKISGKLFYDNAHVINGDAQNPLQSQPKRFSLWEIHPVSQFFVCKRTTNNCNIDTDSDWTPLEKAP